MAGTELDYGYEPPQRCPQDPFGGKDVYASDMGEMGPTKSDLVYGPGTSGHIVTDEEMAEKMKNEEGKNEEDEQLWRPPPPPPPAYDPLTRCMEPPSSDQYQLKDKAAPKSVIKIAGTSRAIVDFVNDPAWFVVKAAKELEVMAKGAAGPLDISREVQGVLVVVDPKKGVTSSQRYVEDLRAQGPRYGMLNCICMIEKGSADPVRISKLSAALMYKGADKVMLEGGMMEFADSYRSGGFAAAFNGSGGSVYIQ